MENRVTSTEREKTKKKKNPYDVLIVKIEIIIFVHVFNIRMDMWVDVQVSVGKERTTGLERENHKAPLNTFSPEGSECFKSDGHTSRELNVIITSVNYTTVNSGCTFLSKNLVRKRTGRKVNSGHYYLKVLMLSNKEKNLFKLFILQFYLLYIYFYVSQEHGES